MEITGLNLIKILSGFIGFSVGTIFGIYIGILIQRATGRNKTSIYIDSASYSRHYDKRFYAVSIIDTERRVFDSAIRYTAKLKRLKRKLPTKVENVGPDLKANGMIE